MFLCFLSAGVHGTPCVAFQIVDGKCRVLREKWFDTRYGTGGLGLRTSGNLVSSTAQGGEGVMEGVMTGVMIGLIDNGFAKRTHLSRYSLYPLCFYSLSSRNLYCLLYCLLYGHLLWHRPPTSTCRPEEPDRPTSRTNSSPTATCRSFESRAWS